MNQPRNLVRACLVAAAALASPSLAPAADPPTAAAVLDGLRDFARRTARPDGSFWPGVDPAYAGMSDSAYSDLAPVVYAVVIHKTSGWELPHEEGPRHWLRARQQDDGAFVNVAGTIDPKSAAGRVYNTTMGLMALHGLGARPKHDPLPVFAKVLERD